MLKNNAKRRIIVASIALFIVSILYFFPNTKENPIKTSTSIINVDAVPIYLLNKDNFLIRTTIASTDNNDLDKIRFLINTLTIGNEKNEYIPKNFTPLIPKNTRVIDLSLTDGLLKINFSKEFLNVSLQNEEKLIESLIYTLTELDSVNEIMIFIENAKLDTLPKSKEKLPNTLNKSYGINKVYDLTSIKDITKTTIYYVGKNENLTYYVPVTKITNNHEDKVKVIIEELKSSPIYETNLISYLATNAKLLDYEELENQIYLSFNEYIFDDLQEKNILEEVKYSISLSLRDTLNIKDVYFKVNDEIIEN